MSKLTFSEVISDVESEINYASQISHHSEEQDENFSVSDWILFLEERLKRAKSFQYTLNTAGALGEIRVIAGLSVSCMKNNGTGTRHYERITNKIK